ncbi:chitin synthase-domain-containing protein [Paraphysoderma sedebokerense]|nr:chitin synthase-domain-containing protein [Paraphysoderma sedebokerense]
MSSGKFVVVFSALILSTICFVYFEFLPHYTCPFYGFTIQELESTPYVAINGHVVDLRSTSSEPLQALSSKFAGRDISTLFPHYVWLGRKSSTSPYYDSDIQACIADPSVADRWLTDMLANNSNVEWRNDIGRIVKCANPITGALDQECRIERDDVMTVINHVRGGILMRADDVAQANRIDRKAYTIIHNKVYDITKYLNFSTVKQSSESRVIDPGRMFLPRDLTEVLLNNIGADATADFDSKVANPALFLRCLDKLYFAGVTESGIHSQCLSLNLVLLVTTAVISGIILVKWILSFHLMRCSRSSSRSNTSPLLFCVSYFSEPFWKIRETIDSITTSHSPDEMKLLVLFVDGITTPVGEMKQNYSLILNYLGHSSSNQETVEYTSLGEGSNAFNRAMVFSGFHRVGSAVLPYMVVVKFGNMAEADGQSVFPGNRGKRDSMHILFNYLSNVSASKLSSPSISLNPLQQVLHQHLTKHLNLDPKLFTMALVLNADVTLKPDAISHLATSLISNSSVVATTGSVQASNMCKNVFTLLQAFPHYVHSHIDPSFKSFLGSLYSTNPNLTMYRLKFPDGRLCTLDKDVIYRFGTTNTKSSSDHNLYLLGEDINLPSILLSRFQSSRIEYLPRAIGFTSLPESFATFKSLFRIQMNSQLSHSWVCTFVNSNRWCWVPSRLQVLAISDLLSHLTKPMNTTVFYYTFVTTIIHQPSAYLAAIAIIGALILCLSLILMLQFQFKLPAIMLFHIIIGLPIMNIILPLYSLWNFDNDLCCDKWRHGHTSILERPHGIKSEQKLERFGERKNRRPSAVDDSNRFSSSDAKSFNIKSDASRRYSEGFNDLMRWSNTSFEENWQYPDNVELTTPQDEQSHQLIDWAPILAPVHPEASLANPFRDEEFPLELTSTDKTHHKGHDLQVQSPPLNPFADPPYHLPPPQLSDSDIQLRFSGISSYINDFVDLPSVDDETPLGSRDSVFAIQTRQRALSTIRPRFPLSFAPNSESSRLSKSSRMISRPVSGITTIDDVSKEEIAEEIHFLLHDADLNSVTKRHVKDHLILHFGEQVVEGFKEFIIDLIEQFVAEKLSLL